MHPIFRQSMRLALPRMLNHPFHKGLETGSLEFKKFDYFLRQDALYLQGYGKSLNQIAKRIEKINDKELFVSLSDYICKTESNMHQKALSPHGFFSKSLKDSVAPGSAVSAYLGFIQQNVACQTVEVSVASMLPCFVMYAEMGLHMKRAGFNTGNIYVKWLQTYAGEQFVGHANTLSAFASQMAYSADLKLLIKMQQAFERSIEHEIDLWDETCEYASYSRKERPGVRGIQPSIRI